MGLELGRVTDRKPPFKYSALDRVGFSDTDAQGIVYYGRYMPYFDLSRVEYHRHLGMGTADTSKARVRHACVHDRLLRAGPLRRSDRGLCPFSRIGRTSVTYDCAAYRVEDDLLLVTAHQTLVLVELATHTAAPVSDRFAKRSAPSRAATSRSDRVPRSS